MQAASRPVSRAFLAALALLSGVAASQIAAPRLELPEGFVATTTPATGGLETFIKAAHSNGMEIIGGIDETSPFSSERVPAWVEFFKTNAPKTMPIVVDGTRLARESGTDLGVVLFRPYGGVEMVVTLQGPITMEPAASVRTLDTLVKAVGRIPEPKR